MIYISLLNLIGYKTYETARNKKEKVISKYIPRLFSKFYYKIRFIGFKLNYPFFLFNILITICKAILLICCNYKVLRSLEFCKARYTTYSSIPTYFSIKCHAN